MDIVMHYTGSKEITWSAAGEYLDSLPILTERGERESWGEITPLWEYRNLLVRVVHTGAEALILLAVADEENESAFALVMKGREWNIAMAMEAGASAVEQLYPYYEFHQRRQVMMELGRMMYRLLSKLDGSVEQESESDEISVRLMIDSYAILLDIEWIEERVRSSLSKRKLGSDEYGE
jgi:hypothetical protein